MKDKQYEERIEEMAKDIGYTFGVAKGVGAVYPSPKMIAIDLYDAGYRKHRKAEWLPQKLCGERVWDCSNCKTLGSPHWKWCPQCGAMIKGEQ